LHDHRLIFTLVVIWLVPFLQIWVVFGAANQLMASLALLLVTLWLMSKGKAYLWTFIPFIFMFITTIAALLYKTYEAFFMNLPAAKTSEAVLANVIIGTLNLILVIAALFLAWDALKAFQRYRAEAAKAPAKA